MVRGKREKIQNWQMGVRSLKIRVGQVCSGDGGQIVQWRHTGWSNLKRKSQC